MGIFDFLRSKKEEITPVIEKVKFSELEKWLQDTLKKEKDREKEVILKITSVIKKTLFELNEEISLLEKVDVSEKKVEEAYKAIVIDSRMKYIDCINVLIEKLEKINLNNLEKMMEDLNKALLDFNQKSRIIFEKATILIGKELGNIKETLGKFVNEINLIFEANKEIIPSLKIIELIKEKLSEMNKIDNEKIGILENIKLIEDEIKNLKEHEELLEKRVENIKDSENYKKDEKEREQAFLAKAEIEHDILKIKTSIDFKALGKLYHTNEKKMTILNDYKNNFNQILINSQELLDLLDKETRDKIEYILIKIKSKREEIDKILSSESPLNNSLSELNQLKEAIKNRTQNITILNKRLGKSEYNLSSIKSVILDNVKKINVEIIS